MEQFFISSSWVYVVTSFHIYPSMSNTKFFMSLSISLTQYCCNIVLVLFLGWDWFFFFVTFIGPVCFSVWTINYVWGLFSCWVFLSHYSKKNTLCLCAVLFSYFSFLPVDGFFLKLCNTGRLCRSTVLKL